MSERPREIELKLEVAARDVKALRSGLLMSLAGKGETSRLGSVYYDTPEGDLRAAGVSLRVRTDGPEIVQTVKRARGSSVGLFDRDEWETALATRAPDWEAFARTPAGATLDLSRLNLEPVFETRIERTRWIVDTHEGSVEVALDSGRVVAGRRTEPLAELELELKRGQPRLLFALVHRLAEVGSLKPGVQVKSERGYRLASGKAPRPVKAEPVGVTRRMTTAAAFQTIVHGCLRHFGLNEPLVVSKRSPEALHQARVALRRLRSALALFKTVVADDVFAELRSELQAVSRDLGDARNLDVYLGERARPEAERQPDEPGVRTFVRDMEARRQEAYERVVARLQSPGFRQLMLRLIEWVEVGPWCLDENPLRMAARERPIRRTAALLLHRQRRRVRRKGRKLADLDPHARHRVRIDAKKLRYAAEFFAGLADSRKSVKRHAVFVAALGALQDHLGSLNDIHTGREIAARWAVDDAASTVASSGLFAAAHVSGREDARVADLLADAAAAHRAFSKAGKFWAGWDA